MRLQVGFSWFYAIIVISSILGYRKPCYGKLISLPVTVNLTNHKAKARSSVHRVIQGGECVMVDWIPSLSAINSAESSMGKTDSKDTAVQMEEKKSKGEPEHDLEEPFNEEFWLKVRHLLSTIQPLWSARFCSLFWCPKCDFSIVFLDIAITCSFIYAKF